MTKKEKVKKLISFKNRAITLKRKSLDLMSDLMDFEEDTYLTGGMIPSDWADNVWAESGDLVLSLEQILEEVKTN